MSPQRALLPDGRPHFNHGPIDLVIEAFGPAGEVVLAYERAWARFPGILPALAAELALLRCPLGPLEKIPPKFEGAVARRMAEAVWPYREKFITPMAAVAGAVADEMLDALTMGGRLRKAYVNDGGDIALFLAAGEKFAAGIVGNLSAPAIDGLAEITAESPVRGIATSGRGGRSFSLGIADAVTVLARTGAQADAAATMIANAVNLDHAAIARQPASTIDPDSDLGNLAVTVAVGPLEPRAVAQALDSGAQQALRLADAGLIEAAMLQLRGNKRIVTANGYRGSQIPFDGGGDFSRGRSARPATPSAGRIAGRNP